MGRLRDSWVVQRRVIEALMLRELVTRYGRENIGFLWIMVEPLMFAALVGLVWRLMKGPMEHGVSVVTFVVTGYLPLTMFRHSITRCMKMVQANGSLLYHRMITMEDFVLVRFLIEFIGGMMAYVVIGGFLYAIDLFPAPADMGLFMAGWFIYSLFTLAICYLIAPLSEASELLEKIVPVTTYLMIPFSGTFNMVAWLPENVQGVMLWSPWVCAMEMMRGGIFGPVIETQYVVARPLMMSIVVMVFGLVLCRRIRRTLVVE